MNGSTNVPGDDFTFSKNAAAIGGLGGSHNTMSLVGADGNSPLFIFYSFGTSSVAPIIVGRHARGTGAAPTATQNTDTLWQLLGQGWGTGWVSSPQIVMSAAESWTGTANGSRVDISTVKNGTTTQITSLTIDHDGQLYAPHLVNKTAASTGSLCWTTSTGLITYDNSSTCLVSSAKYKNSIAAWKTSALTLINKLVPVTFSYNTNLGMAPGTRLGLIAEDVAKVIPNAALPNATAPDKIDPMAIIAVLVKAVQELQIEINTLRGGATPVLPNPVITYIPPVVGTFVPDIFNPGTGFKPVPVN